MARHQRRPGRHPPGSDDRGAHRRGHPRHLVGHLRLRPAPLRGARHVHGRGRHPRARADGRRRGGRPGGRGAAARRSRRRPLQHLLRALLHVRPEALLAVRDDAGDRTRQGRRALRLHAALRVGARRAGGVPAGPARRRLRGQGAGRAAGRALRLPLGRAADRVAGGRLRRRPGRRDLPRHGPRPDRADVGADRPPPRRRPRDRRRPGARAARDGRAARDRDAGLAGLRRGRRRGARADARAAAPTRSSTPSAWRRTGRPRPRWCRS